MLRGLFYPAAPAQTIGFPHVIDTSHASVSTRKHLFARCWIHGEMPIGEAFRTIDFIIIAISSCAAFSIAGAACILSILLGHVNYLTQSFASSTHKARSVVEAMSLFKTATSIRRGNHTIVLRLSLHVINARIALSRDVV